jgi:hypothetical protein
MDCFLEFYEKRSTNPEENLLKYTKKSGYNTSQAFNAAFKRCTSNLLACQKMTKKMIAIKRVASQVKADKFDVGILSKYLSMKILFSYFPIYIYVDLRRSCYIKLLYRQKREEGEGKDQRSRHTKSNVPRRSINVFI